MFVFGGGKDDIPLNDFFSFDMNTHTWKRLNDESTPKARKYH